MPGLNQEIFTLPVLSFEAGKQDEVILEQGVRTSHINCRLTGTFKQVGVANDGVLHLGTPLTRIIQKIHLPWDSFPIIDNVPLRDLYQFSLMGSVQENTTSNPTVNAAGTTALELHFVIWFARPWLARPYDTHLPPLPSERPLRLFVTWASAVSDILSAGTDTYTFDTNVTLEMEQVTYPGSLEPPQFLPVYEQHQTAGFTAADPRLEFRMSNFRMFDSIVFRSVYNPTEILQESINDISFKAAGKNWWTERNWQLLQAAEAREHQSTNEELGYLRYMFADGGLLSNRVIPRQHTDLRFEFDVDAPTAGTGRIYLTQAQLMSVEGITATSPSG